MDIICAYCKIKYGEKEGEGVSHGICPSCFEIEMTKIEKIEKSWKHLKLKDWECLNLKEEMS